MEIGTDADGFLVKSDCFRLDPFKVIPCIPLSVPIDIPDSFKGIFSRYKILEFKNSIRYCGKLADNVAFFINDLDNGW